MFSSKGSLKVQSLRGKSFKEQTFYVMKSIEYQIIFDKKKMK